MLCYDVEVCPDCAWHHLTRKYPAGGRQGGAAVRAGAVSPRPTVRTLAGSQAAATAPSRIVMVTAYDHPTATIASAAGVDLILVGDTVADNVLGYDDTLQVTIDDMERHVAAVARAKPDCLIVGDMPWMSYHVSLEETVRNAARLIRAGAECVKLEGGRKRVAAIEAIVQRRDPGHGAHRPDPAVGPRDGGLPGPGPQGRRGHRAARRRQRHRRGRLLRHGDRGRPRRGGHRGHRRSRRPHHRHRGRARTATARCSSSTTCSASAPGRPPSSCASTPTWPKTRSQGAGRVRGRRAQRGLPGSEAESYESSDELRLALEADPSAGLTETARPGPGRPALASLRRSTARSGGPYTITLLRTVRGPGPGGPGPEGGEAACGLMKSWSFSTPRPIRRPSRASSTGLSRRSGPPGGNPGTVDRWGRRPFAYEVNHRREGYYVLIELTGETQTVNDLDRLLTLADEVIRHKVIRLPDQVAGRATGERGPRGDGEPGRLSRPARQKERTMPTDNAVVLVGNVTRDPELRFTNTGQATATFGLAVNRRWQNRQTQEWEEATSFFDVVCWREMAENVSESLVRGSRVMVAGRLEQRSWETQDGDKRSKVEVVADEVGPSLRWATAQVTKNDRRGPSDGGGRGGGGGRRRAAAPATDRPAYSTDEEPF